MPEKVTVAAHVSMRDEPLQRAMRRLTGGQWRSRETRDVRAELKTEGARADSYAISRALFRPKPARAA